MEHTKGQWIADNHLLGDGWRVFIQHGAGNDQHDAICDLETWQTEKETEANARLIASAPDLLEACEILVRIIRGTLSGGVDIHGIERPWMRKAKKAIRRAKGE
uniref:Uncharacterized protein n=1 Tax=viral metagenome TaxID=1070528 RepID=A0A6M3JR48_9ZZZZ